MAYRLSGRGYAIDRFVNQKVEPLQRALFERGHASAIARAKMARLRKLVSGEMPSLLTIGDDVLADWREEELGVPDGGSPELRAVCTALGCYALMQQGKGRPVAEIAQVESDRPGLSFGRACWKIQPDRELADGVVRRLSSIEGASDFEGVVTGVRSLLNLMRSARQADGAPRSIKLDFGLLAADLYELQGGEAQRAAVLSRWGAAYYVHPSHEDRAEEE